MGNLFVSSRFCEEQRDEAIQSRVCVRPLDRVAFGSRKRTGQLKETHHA